MGIHSQDTKHAGAWRLHVLGATLDHTAECDHPQGICKGGSGKIERAQLQAAAETLGVKRSTFYNWLADARQAGILNGMGEYLYLASQAKLSQILLCNSIDEHKAIVSIKQLFKPGWKALVWAAYLKANHHKRIGYTERLEPVHKGNVISAKTLEDLTGINPRTQRRYKKHIKTRPNIGITDIPGDWETAEKLNEAARDNGQPRHYFPFNDPEQTDPAGIKQYRRVIAFTMPARRDVSNKAAVIGARGRRAQIERAILKGLQLVNVCNHSDINYLPKVQAGTQTEAKRQRRYFDAKLLQSLQFREWTHEEAREVYILRANERRHMGVWDRERI
jgi:hypothetical protein